MQNQTIDNLDKRIINSLMANARTPYAELAKQFAVSPATIHVRIEKLKNMGIITGTQMTVAPKQLGYDVCCFIGINLKSAGAYQEVLEQLETIDEVLEVYYTTGQYSVMIKVMTQNIDELQWLLIDKIQSIAQVQATETLISLQNPINRNIKI